jgi:hypothetical protein
MEQILKIVQIIIQRQSKYKIIFALTALPTKILNNFLRNEETVLDNQIVAIGKKINKISTRDESQTMLEKSK